MLSNKTYGTLPFQTSYKEHVFYAIDPIVGTSLTSYHTKNTADKKRKYLYNILLFTLLLTSIVLFPRKVFAADETVYKDGIYCYTITDDTKKEVRLIGIEYTKAMKELLIPGKALINGTEYSVSEVNFQYAYYNNEIYQEFYQSVEKLKILDTFTGTIQNPLYALEKINTIELLGTNLLPKKIYTTVWNGNKNLDILFLVPKGYEKEYRNIIDASMYYYTYSDLYERDLNMVPTIASSKDDVEYGCFSVNDFIYQVTNSAKNGKGEVQLIGITKASKSNYAVLPEQVKNNGYTYKLTKISKYGLVGYMVPVVVIPDTVTEMESHSLGSSVELLFLSKNCKVIPSWLITDENNESNLRFVSVPEGVTTISDYAFRFFNSNQSSVILPTTIKSVGEQSLYGINLVTFLNKKPVTNIPPAIKKGTTVKVQKAAISAYQKQLNKGISVVAAKDIVKSKEITVNKSSITMDTLNTYTLKGSLTKGSNETVYWLSTNTAIFDISSKGVINPKAAGTAYVVAYTRTSGLQKLIKVTVTDKLITEGIFTFKISDALNKKVTLCAIKPKFTTKKVSIPEKITYKNKTYTVTGVIADSKDSSIPLMSDKYNNNNITEIIFPKTITGTVGYLGFMKSIKSITFKGTKAPHSIQDWYADGGLLASQAVIHVPAKSSSSYNAAIWTTANYDAYYTVNYGCGLNFNILEPGNDQVTQFAVDGILYTVTKKAGTQKGEVSVKGADVNLDTINIGNTVKNGKYSYHVTTIKARAFYCSNAKKIILGDAITKVESKVLNEKVEYVKWPKNSKTIAYGIFTPSWEIESMVYSEQIKFTSKSDFYALKNFFIPDGVTTIKGNVFEEGFGNLKSITIPKSVTSIAKKAFNTITEVKYE